MGLIYEASLSIDEELLCTLTMRAGVEAEEELDSIFVVELEGLAS